MMTADAKMDNHVWFKLASALCSVGLTIALGWLCWNSVTLVAHGQRIAGVETKADIAERRAGSLQTEMVELRVNVRADIAELRNDIKTLLQRIPQKQP